MNQSRILLLAVLWLVFCAKIRAEEAYPTDSMSTYIGKEIIIEAFKQNRGVYLEPLSASVLSAKEINARNINSIKDFSAYIPNLYLPDYGSKMISPVYIRGIGSRINAPSVALYVDGVPYFDRASFDLEINDIDNIEVLRGPQGTIYGRNAMGGVINIYTKSPLKYQGTHLNLGTGNHKLARVGIAHYSKINDRLAYSLATSYEHKGGYFTNKFTGKKADPLNQYSTRGRITYRVSPQLMADLTIAYEYTDQDGYPYRVYDVEKKEMGPIDYNEPSFYKRKLSTNGLHLSYVTEHFKLGSQSSFQFMDGKQGLDQDFTPHDAVFVDFYHRQQMYSQEFNIKSLGFDNRYEWQFGAFGFHQNYAQNNDVDYRALKKHLLSDVKNPTYGYALYHQSTLNDILVKNLSFIFGIRYDWEKTKSTLKKSNYLYDQDITYTEPQKESQSFNQLTPKFALNYSFGGNRLAYASVTRGYKTGGFNTTVEVEKDKKFKPEYSWSYELGAKSSFFNNLIHLDFSLFFIDWKDQQISQKNPSGQGYVLRNAGKSESKGMEITADLNPLKNFDIQLAYGYTKATFKDYKDGGEKDGIIFDGNYLPMVPKHTFSLSTGYKFNVNCCWLNNIVINAQYLGLGRIYWNDSHTVSQAYYDQVNANVSFNNKNVSLEVWTKNIANKKYISYHFAIKETNYVQRGTPFTCGVNINLKF